VGTVLVDEANIWKLSSAAGFAPYIWTIYRAAGFAYLYMDYIGMCGPKGYGFSAVLVINWVSILAISPPFWS